MEEANLDIKNGKVYLDENGIIRMKTGETADLNHVKSLVGKFIDIAKASKIKYKILIDISASNPKFDILWRKEIVKIFIDAYRDPGYKKIALWGAKNKITETVGAFLIGATGLKNVKYFKTEKEALEWLNKNEV